jgi:protocatechuate 3,4-dioxygenase beta subunit|tara:strand:- start:17451 stop:18086 length:636 start_codon:yes stop_codon:yes gene_type:complete
MLYIKCILPVILFILSSCSGFAQKKSVQNARLVGGPCQGCEAVLGFTDQTLSPTDTLPEFTDSEPKLKITGTVYQNDGVTPAEGVILFVHQTNTEGVYPTRGDEKGWERGYGYIHGWIKTGADGKYAFYTFRPGSYGRNAAHIHPVILEPSGRYYWVEAFFFDDDPKLSDEHTNSNRPRGGSDGVLSLREEDGLLVGERDFILGKNIQNYE